MGWLPSQSGREDPWKSLFREASMKQALCVLERRMFQGEGATRQNPSEGLLGVSMQEPEVEMLETRGKGVGCGGGRSPISMWEELDSVCCEQAASRGHRAAGGALICTQRTLWQQGDSRTLRATCSFGDETPEHHGVS